MIESIPCRRAMPSLHPRGLRQRRPPRSVRDSAAPRRQRAIPRPPTQPGNDGFASPRLHAYVEGRPRHSRPRASIHPGAAGKRRTQDAAYPRAELVGRRHGTEYSYSSLFQRTILLLRSIFIFNALYPRMTRSYAFDEYDRAMLRPENWTRPAGASPVRVMPERPVAGPGSSPRGVGLSGVSKASSEGASVRAVVPPGTSPAASSHSQRRSRAAHVTAKAAFDLLAIRTCPWSSPSGVRGAARTHGLVRDRRGPSAQPRQQRPSV